MAAARLSAEFSPAMRTTSHGRGGAGNFAKGDSATDPSELVTPTIKADHYTTGRGGSGNMARNDPAHPEVARAAQDIAGPAPREPEGKFHYGRGGAANIGKPNDEEAKLAHDANVRRSHEMEREIARERRSGSSERGEKLKEKGRHLIGKIVGH